VLIGTGTLRAEGYDRLVKREQRRQRRVAAGLARDPLAVILSRRFDVPWDAGLFQAPEQPVLVYTGTDAGDPPDVPAPVEVVRLEVAGLTEMLADLRSRGVRALLSEGGPTMHGALHAAGVVDEVFLTVAPLLTGDADEPNVVEGGRLPDAVELELLSVRREGSEVFLRYGRAS
jgi:riboflavin biosynthesis pyrimidine reductase